MSSNADVKDFLSGVDENFKSWEKALHALPRRTEDERLHLGRCFHEFKTFFAGTKGWQLFFIRSAERDDAEGLSERNVGLMMAAAQLMDWAEEQTNSAHLVDLINEIMQRGQNYGMRGLASVNSLPRRYWEQALHELKRVGDAKRTRRDYEWRERSWRLATMGNDVLAAMVRLERPGRTIEMMLEHPQGYDRTVADAIFAEHNDEKRIATITVQKVMEFLAEDIRDVLSNTDRLKAERAAADADKDPDLAGIKRLMELPDEERQDAMKKVAIAITKYKEGG